MASASRMDLPSHGNEPSKTSVTATQGPPKPPRSAFICFKDAKKEEIMARHTTMHSKDILNLVAEEWKGLDDRERSKWDEEARNDKLRYVREKANYKGPWNLPKRRAKKHPMAPKRTMSAFLKYSQQRRAEIKAKNPDLSNTDVSRLLGEMWRNASPAERAPYVEQELLEREQYKQKMKAFREKQAKIDAASRTSHQSVQHITEKSFQSTDRSGFDEHGEPYMFEPLGVHQPIGEPLSGSDQGVFRAYRNPIADTTNRNPFRRMDLLESAPSKEDPRSIRSFAPPSQPDEANAHGYRSVAPYYAPRQQYRQYQGESRKFSVPSTQSAFLTDSVSFKDSMPDLNGDIADQDTIFNGNYQRSSSKYFNDAFYGYP